MSFRKYWTLVGFVAIIAGLGVLWLAQSTAATFATASEAEAGLLAGAAGIQANSGTSGAGAVRFGLITTPNPTPPTPPPTTGGRTINVASSSELTSAIANAVPGDTIRLADGTYTGKLAVGKYSGAFSIIKNGTATAPITLTGSRNAVINGGGISGSYGLYIVNASYWNIIGITVTSAAKAIVLDNSNYVRLDNIRAYGIGSEAIHFRASSSHNIITGSTIEQTGLVQPQYGEGVYIGSAKSNWGTYSGGNPDTSDYNQVVNNTIRNTGAENIDIKEGSSYGVVTGNHFDAIGMSGENFADSWIDVKGNNYTISDNTAVVSGVAVFVDGFQIHQALTGWGNNNIFHGNSLNLNNASGAGFLMQKGVTGTVLSCDNTVNNAQLGFAISNGTTVACNP